MFSKLFCRIGFHKMEIESESPRLVRWRVCTRPHCKLNDLYFVDYYSEDKPNKLPRKEKVNAS